MTRIARNRNASANSASTKNKAVAANKAVAGNRVVINKEATSKADDNLVLSDYSDGGGQLPPFACPCADRLQLQTNLQPPRS